MKITNRIKNAFQGFIDNSFSINDGPGLAQQFRRFGNDRMYQDWSQVIMNEQDKYTGYLYAAVNNRAKKVAMLAENNLRTEAVKDLMDQAKNKEEPLTHPYVDLIDESKDFTNYRFWYEISTYLDLKGRYYLLVVRNKQGNRNGEIQHFKLLNPYNVRRVVSETTRELQGYVEAKDGLTRNIPLHMIIEISQLNPFSDDEPYSMTDAAKDSQFTLKTAGDHTRHSVAKNRSTPGIVTINDDELALDPQKMANFKSRIVGKEKGEPIFGVGKGSITWNDMQVDLNKSAVDKVNEVSLKNLIAVTGNSKTVFGIEESGVTRDTSGDQKSMFITDHALPQVQLIIDSLNQDYKNYYEQEYQKTKYKLVIESPSEDDKEVELKEQDLRTKQLELYDFMRNKGYTHKIASKYANGEMTLLELGEPTEEPKLPSTDLIVQDQEDNRLKTVTNQFEEEEQGIILQQQGALENAVRNVEQRTTAAVLNKVTKNNFDSEADIINKTDRREQERELDQALQAFYLIVIPLFASRTLNRRAQEFNKRAMFKVNNEVKRYVKAIANKASISHLDTVLEDLRKAIQQSALTGATQQELINKITSKYVEISKNRAKAIARTETNRAFTQSQFHADKQFLEQNGLTAKAYKKWITTSDNPCPLCVEMSSRPPVRFKQDFLDFGSELVVSYVDDNEKTKVIKQTIDFEPLEAGNLHVNCGCKYQLIIE